ncbi:MAG: exodeoxyribonuclease III [Desulfobacterales bacterium]
MTQNPLKLVSWNVNGLRAVMKKGFSDALKKLDADIVALQETKLQEDQLTAAMRRVHDYDAYFCHASVKKGYSGVAAYTRIKPDQVNYGIGVERFDNEGRIIEMDLGDVIFFNVYFPNGQMSDERLQYKLDFYEAFFAHADDCRKRGYSVIVTGDFNTAHNEIDLKNPKANAARSGFLRIERDWMDHIVNRGYVDTFRALYPDTVKYSWWTYRFNARQNNAGWRIDYFFVSRDLFDSGRVQDAFIDNSIYGSDHCPVGLVVNI